MHKEWARFTALSLSVFIKLTECEEICLPQKARLQTDGINSWPKKPVCEASGHSLSIMVTRAEVWTPLLERVVTVGAWYFTSKSQLRC